MKRIGLVANTDKPACRAALQTAAALIAESGRQVLYETATAQMVGLSDWQACADLSTLAGQCDLLAVFGGDGTILRVARATASDGTPLFGINFGKLGFLTAVHSSHLNSALGQLWAGKFAIEPRPLIHASGQCAGQSVSQLALNDFVISRGAGSRIIEIEVSVDDEVLTQYRCDGLIVSSPTGSTAYSLAAGGAIVSPQAEVFTITPICPHTLSNRSVIVSLNSIVQVKLQSARPETSFAADGQVEMRLAAGDQITIRRSQHTIRLVHLTGSSFFQTLRHKLNWGGTSDE